MVKNVLHFNWFFHGYFTRNFFVLSFSYSDDSAINNLIIRLESITLEEIIMISKKKVEKR